MSSTYPPSLRAILFCGLTLQPFFILVCSVLRAFGDADAEGDEATVSQSLDKGSPAKDEAAPESVKVNLPLSLMDKAFPWHFAVDRQSNIISAGSRLVARFPVQEGLLGRSFMETMKVVRPTHVQADFDQLNEIVHKDTLIVIRDTHYTRRREFGSSDSACPMHDRRRRSSAVDAEHIIRLQRDLYLRGELVYSAEHDALIFLGIPSISDAEDIDYLNVRREDMPIHSNGHELLFSIAHQSASMKMTEDMTAVMDNLDETMKELETSKKRTTDLLHSLLPKVRNTSGCVCAAPRWCPSFPIWLLLLLSPPFPNPNPFKHDNQSVADKLALGIKPEAEKYDNVSILFSDIVGFTTISSMAHPTEVRGASITRHLSRRD